MGLPSATYRFQFNSHFTFDDAVKYIDYLSELGISHIYASPCLQAKPGSTHGYDVVDHSKINAELGGENGFKWFLKKLKEKGMGIIMDIVPNHMAICGPENKWWWDVLENGPSSYYSSYFDVDWEFPPELPDNKVLLPILGNHYGRIIEAKEIVIQRNESSFFIRYYEHILPASPKSLINILMPVASKIKSDELFFIISSLHHLPPPSLTDRVLLKSRNRDKNVVYMLLSRIINEQAHIRKLIDEEIESINNNKDKIASFLEKQNYRLAFWKVAWTDLGYRRFFNINSLVALHTEDLDVFADTHNLILSLIKENAIDGLRIDHIDGLLDPEEYLIRLKEKAENAWIIAEKILHHNEDLRKSWPVYGTTGYDFMNSVSQLFVNNDNEKSLTELYEQFTGETHNYHAIIYKNKIKIMDNVFTSDINRLVLKLFEICQNNMLYRDFLKNELSMVLKEYIAQLEVYRTYIRYGDFKVSEEDKKIISVAANKAEKQNNNIDPALFDLLQTILISPANKKEIDFARQLQQLTGPVMAKGVEDTSFYCYNRFVMLNEVGGDPSAFGMDIGSFHSKHKSRSEQYPFSMLSTSTHDTKRSEDVRARLAVISEVPELWKTFVMNSLRNNEKYKKNDQPEKNMEYLLYQNIIGAWPVDKERIIAYAEKAAREAKIYTSWIKQDAQYEKSLKVFIESLYNDRIFMDSVDRFVAEIIYPGRINSLAFVLLKITCPGVPDIYQGSELWDLSLVDPDNRRPVNYKIRLKLLDEIKNMNAKDVCKRMDQGLPKLYLIHKILAFRKARPELFNNQTYNPITPQGNKNRNIIAFNRGNSLITVVPRFIKGAGNNWDDTCITIPEGVWVNILDGKAYSESTIKIQDLFALFPVSFLAREDKTGK